MAIVDGRVVAPEARGLCIPGLRVRSQLHDLGRLEPERALEDPRGALGVPVIERGNPISQGASMAKIFPILSPYVIR